MFLEEQVREEKEETEQGQWKALMSDVSDAMHSPRQCSAKANRPEGQHLTTAVTSAGDPRLSLSEAPEAFQQWTDLGTRLSLWPKYS